MFWFKVYCYWCYWSYWSYWMLFEWFEWDWYLCCYCWKLVLWYWERFLMMVFLAMFESPLVFLFLLFLMDLSLLRFLRCCVYNWVKLDFYCFCLLLFWLLLLVWLLVFLLIFYLYVYCRYFSSGSCVSFCLSSSEIFLRFNRLVWLLWCYWWYWFNINGFGWVCGWLLRR